MEKRFHGWLGVLESNSISQTVAAEKAGLVNLNDFLAAASSLRLALEIQLARHPLLPRVVASHDVLQERSVRRSRLNIEIDDLKNDVHKSTEYRELDGRRRDSEPGARPTSVELLQSLDEVYLEEDLRY